jgi:GTP-binding protein LepA
MPNAPPLPVALGSLARLARRFFSTQNNRNFCIIAHIDHGKSTLADRMIEHCTSGFKIEGAQVLDRLAVEKERGITVKSQSVSLKYTLDGQIYTLNLIDTPGHADFGYEVTKTLAAVEGAILLIDATKGVQAQTVANFNKAKGQNLALIPALNKCDLASADPESVREELVNLLEIPHDK